MPGVAQDRIAPGVFTRSMSDDVRNFVVARIDDQQFVVLQQSILVPPEGRDFARGSYWDRIGHQRSRHHSTNLGGEACWGFLLPGLFFGYVLPCGFFLGAGQRQFILRHGYRRRFCRDFFGAVASCRNRKAGKRRNGGDGQICSGVHGRSSI